MDLNVNLAGERNSTRLTKLARRQLSKETYFRCARMPLDRWSTGLDKPHSAFQGSNACLGHELKAPVKHWLPVAVLLLSWVIRMDIQQGKALLRKRGYGVEVISEGIGKHDLAQVKPLQASFDLSGCVKYARNATELNYRGLEYFFVR